MTGLGVGFLILDVINQGDHIPCWWGVVLIIAAFLPGSLLLVMHSGRLTAQPVS